MAQGRRQVGSFPPQQQGATVHGWDPVGSSSITTIFRGIVSRGERAAQGNKAELESIGPSLPCQGPPHGTISAMTGPEILQPQANELGALVQALHAEGRPWLPAGQASRLGWGPVVAPACTVIRTSGLNRILDHNPGDFTIRLEAGTPLQTVQQALAEQGQWLAVDWPWGSGALGGGSIAGLVARGLTGGYRQKYLGIRDQLIGIGLMRADGVSAKAGGQVVKMWRGMTSCAFSPAAGAPWA